MFPVCAGIEMGPEDEGHEHQGCFPCVRELKHRADVPDYWFEMFPVCAGIEIHIKTRQI